MTPDAGGDAVNAAFSIATQEQEIKEILDKHPEVSREQAAIDVAFMNVLIGRRSYNS